VNGEVVGEPADADELARAMQSSLGLGGFAPPDLPTAEQWVTRMTDLMEKAAQSRAERRGSAG
jgi:hypothetical protein